MIPILSGYLSTACHTHIQVRLDTRSCEDAARAALNITGQEPQVPPEAAYG